MANKICVKGTCNGVTIDKYIHLAQDSVMHEQINTLKKNISNEFLGMFGSNINICFSVEER